MAALRDRRVTTPAAHRATKDRALLEAVFARADIRFDGKRPFDIRVTDDRFYKRVLLDGSLGLGEAYVDGWWEADRIDELMCRFARANMHKPPIDNVRLLLSIARLRVSNIGARSKAFEVGHRHYDLGNDLFRAMLDERMIYSCAYWKDAATLDEAQANKLDLVCRKLALQPGMRVLEIGCGWGGWARFAAEHYGVSVVGLTVSSEQLAFARKYCAGLPIDVRLQDYRHINERFDRVVSIGMFEHVGHRYHRTFMNVVDRCLSDDGLFLLHSITGNVPIGSAEVPWITKHIFPNGEIPSLAQVARSAEGLFVVEAMHHLANDYERTLSSWHDNFVARWATLASVYDQRFYRQWCFYLLMSRGLFQARVIHLWQIVFSKNGVPNKAAGKDPSAARLAGYDAR